MVKREYTLALIESVVKDRYCVTSDELRQRTRKERISFPRQILFYVASHLLQPVLYKNLALNYGLVNHASAIHGVRHVRDLMTVDMKFMEEMMMINSIIKEKLKR